MKILAIVANFPSLTAPYSGIFIQRTLLELSRMGAEVTVIAPQKWHDKRMPTFSCENGLNIYRPLYLSLGAKQIFNFNTIKVTHRNFIKTVLRRSKKINFTPDFVYSHFLMPAGKSSIKVAQYFGVDVFCSLGESDILNYERFYRKEQLQKIYNQFKKLLPNSLQIKNTILTRYVLGENQITYIPNGIDSTVFYPMDKMDCRKKLGLPENEKIVIFVGGFIERKGPLRVLEACKKTSYKLKMIFIGEGPQKPKDPDILYAGKINPNEIPLFLNSSDVFVLPTKNEGMPNAILEAMACNIPIVTSNIAVNKIILEEYVNKKLCAFNDIEAFTEGIEQMLTVNPSDNYEFIYTIENRTERILDSFKD